MYQVPGSGLLSPWRVLDEAAALGQVRLLGKVLGYGVSLLHLRLQPEGFSTNQEVRHEHSIPLGVTPERGALAVDRLRASCREPIPYGSSCQAVWARVPLGAPC